MILPVSHTTLFVHPEQWPSLVTIINYTRGRERVLQKPARIRSCRFVISTIFIIMQKTAGHHHRKAKPATRYFDWCLDAFTQLLFLKPICLDFRSAQVKTQDWLLTESLKEEPEGRTLTQVCTQNKFYLLCAKQDHKQNHLGGIKASLQ